jgi:CheY-like chemotaxis protein
MSDKSKWRRGEFFSTISHRVRQPLGAILEELAAMRRRDLPPDEAALAQLLTQQTHDLLSVVNEVQDLIRLEEGNFFPAREVFDLRDVLEGLRSSLSEALRRHGGSFDFLIHPETPAQLWGDAGRLRQLLSDLVLAVLVKHRPREIFMDAAADSETPPSVVLRFNVCGVMDPAAVQELKDLVDATGQWDNAPDLLHRDDAGACLRLLLAHRLAKILGGRLEVPSGPSTGFMLSYTAPFDRPLLSYDRHAGAADAVVGLRVLVAADDDESAQRLGAWLRTFGCQVETSPVDASGLAKLRAARGAKRFEVVLLVSHAHGQAAEDFGRAVKADPKLSPVELLLVTAAGRRGDAARLREIGFAAYLTEPVEPGQVHQALSLIAARLQRPAPAPDAGIITRHLLRERQRRRLRVAVVDRQPVHSLLTMRALEKLGCEAYSRQLDDLAPTSPDDVWLIDAEDALPLMASLRRQASAPVVIGMAAANQTIDAPRFLDGGLFEVLPKPLSEVLLRDVLARVMAQRSVDESGAAGSSAASWSEFTRQFDGDNGAAGVALDYFVENAAARLRDLRSALDAAETASAAALADELTDTAAQFALRPLQQRLADLATALRQGHHQTALDLWDEAMRTLAQIKSIKPGPGGS